MNDYISREDVLNGRIWVQTSNGVEVSDMQAVPVGYIANLSPADVQPVVHGEWIKTMEGNAFRDKCSECESLYPNAFGYNWCPNCGAKMDKRKGASE